ncbi:MAG TPA: dihydrolipoamide acetyltransferase family protein [Tepidisphaeraceae bacterium]|jgi:pyruvate dehydrogenase E2 component (dihydrolipoamide acetyltransferase)
MIARNTDENEFCLPDLGEGLEEAELIEWSVHVGERVEENQTLAKMETAKALVEVPSPRGGVIAILHGKPGQSIKVGSPLVTYAQEGEAEAFRPEMRRKKEPAQPAESRPDAGTVVGNVAEAPAADEEGKVLATPAVRRLARDLAVDLAQVRGTGIGGRIMEHDLQQAADGGALRPVEERREPAPSGSAVSASLQRTAPALGADATRIPFRGVRRAIAEHLRHSVSHAIHFTVMDEADVTALDEMRRRLMAAANEKISLLPFVASAVCRVLSGKEGPKFIRLNCTVDDDKQEIIQHRSVHLGIATDTESGLMVPVIRNAERLGVMEISRQVAQLAQAARDRSIPHEQLTGSTFTISNFGSIAGRFGTPIINYPEAGILAVGRAHEGVVVRAGMIGVGKLLPLSLAADHRVIDGGTAAIALAKIIDLLQKPEELLPPGR